MARYAIHIYCDECSAPHPMGVSVVLNDGPPELASVAEHYAGKTVPGTLNLMLRNCAKCPKTGKMFQQWDSKKIFIAPVAG
ncbi:MAG: hypothetical protein H6Q05_2494 [Acidobacteria bacterium]|nr:hypothetical protein [Acidobacteriota bacterium]